MSQTLTSPIDYKTDQRRKLNKDIWDRQTKKYKHFGLLGCSMQHLMIMMLSEYFKTLNFKKNDMPFINMIC